MWIDSHHHLWDPAVRPQTWMDPSSSINRPFGTDDLRRAIADTPVGITVVVQTLSSAAETVELLDLASSDPLIGGVVGWLDLHDDVGLQLDHLELAGTGELLVSVRHQAEDEPDAAWLANTDVVDSVCELGRRGLAFDLLIKPHQLGSAIDLAHATSDTTRLVLDHCAKPPIGFDLSDWATSVRMLASFDHVACKLSGLVTESNWESWTHDDLAPVADIVLECFGPRRVMFGSDWPVCLLAASYVEVVDAAQALVADLSPSERQSVFCGTAREWYGLP